jgi:carbonic anhydrase/acetyltransferase-like protein (isoleucine patch superfamily)
VLIKAFLVADAGACIEDNSSQSPTALTEVLGHTVLEHIAAHLRRNGIQDIAVISREKVSDLIFDCVPELRSAAEDGIDVAIVIGASEYAEVDWESAVAHHLHHLHRVTPIYTPRGRDLKAFLVTPALVTEPIETELWRSRALPYRMHSEEYSASLETARGLRQLASDALHGICSLEINGKEVRPGIWVGQRARIEKGARLVAPVYVGSRTRVRAGAVITRGSSVEQHCLIDCGTIVENSTVLPFIELGPGLDARHSVAGQHVIFNLPRAVAVPVADGKIMRLRPRGAMSRVVDSAARLAAYLPQSIAQSLRNPELPASAPALSGSASADFGMQTSKKEPRGVGKFAPGLAVMRRYGNE